MKTAEEWANEVMNLSGKALRGEIPMPLIDEPTLLEQVIKQIQLDAFKAGERFAAEIVKQEIAQWLVGTTGDNTKVEIEESCCKAILDDANNRTELP